MEGPAAGAVFPGPGGVAFLEKRLKAHGTVILEETWHDPMMVRAEEAARACPGFLKEKQ
jgi:hypothetical protein